MHIEPSLQKWLDVTGWKFWFNTLLLSLHTASKCPGDSTVQSWQRLTVSLVTSSQHDAMAKLQNWYHSITIHHNLFRSCYNKHTAGDVVTGVRFCDESLQIHISIYKYEYLHKGGEREREVSPRNSESHVVSKYRDIIGQVTCHVEVKYNVICHLKYHVTCIVLTFIGGFDMICQRIP